MALRKIFEPNRAEVIEYWKRSVIMRSVRICNPHHIRGLSGKYPVILNISRTGDVTLF